MSEWKEYKISELGKVVTGNTPSSKNPEEWGTLVAFVTPTDFDSYNKSIEGSIRYLSERGASVFNSKILPPNSVIVTCIGSQMGKVALSKVPCVTNQQINSIIPNEKFNADFIFYLISSMQDYLRNLATGGSTMPIVNKSNFENIKIRVPNLSTQIAIAEILSSIDDKIELNNKINKELESLAQALFNLIFLVDEAQDNDGWRTIKLKDILSIKNGYAFKGMDFIESGIPVIKIKNVKAGKINFNNLSYVSEKIANKAEKFKIKKYDLLITMSGNRIDGSMDTWVGKVGMFPKIGEYLLNQRVSILNLNNIKLKYYLLQLLSSEEYQYHFISNATSSGGQANISPDLIYNTEILLPPTDKIEIFDSVASDIYSIIFNNMSENEALIELREILLPKLISGELEINEYKN